MQSSRRHPQPQRDGSMLKIFLQRVRRHTKGRGAGRQGTSRGAASRGSSKRAAVWRARGALSSLSCVHEAGLLSPRSLLRVSAVSRLQRATRLRTDATVCRRRVQDGPSKTHISGAWLPFTGSSWGGAPNVCCRLSNGEKGRPPSASGGAPALKPCPRGAEGCRGVVGQAPRKAQTRCFQRIWRRRRFRVHWRRWWYNPTRHFCARPWSGAGPGTRAKDKSITNHGACVFS